MAPTRPSPSPRTTTSSCRRRSVTCALQPRDIPSVDRGFRFGSSVHGLATHPGAIAGWPGSRPHFFEERVVRADCLPGGAPLDWKALARLAPGPDPEGLGATNELWVTRSETDSPTSRAP